MRSKKLWVGWFMILSVLLAACAGGGGGGGESQGATGTTGTTTTSSGGSKQSSSTTPTPSPANVSGKVVIYSSASESLLEQMTPKLKAAYPNLEVEWVYGGTESLVDRLTAEFAAGRVGADAVMMADPAFARLLKDQGSLLPYVPQGADRVLVDRDPEGYYTSIRVIDTIIIYNPELVKPEEAPKSFKDLLDPKWAGKVAMSDPTKSGTAFATMGALVQTYGWEYFEQAQKNGWLVGGGSSEPAKLVDSGKALVGISVESTFRSNQAKGAKLEMIWPADGAIVMESPYAILKDTKNPQGAKAVADWLLTEEAQNLVSGAQMHPVISGIPAPEGSLTLDNLLKGSMAVDWAHLAQHKGDLQDRFLQVVTINN